jgi:hypothetical protein
MPEIPSAPIKNLSLEQLATTRKNTQAVADFLEKQLLANLETLRVLLLPERLVGRLAGTRTEVAGATKGLAELQTAYKQFAGKPFEFPKEFETDWLSEVGTNLDLHRWEYNQEIETDSGKKAILITSPIRWILTYGPTYSLAQAIQAFGRKQDRRGTDQLRQFVVNAMVIQTLLARSAGLRHLFSQLRYDVLTQAHPGLHGLPVIVIQSQVPVFLPPEPVIATATELSGVPAFLELIDIDAVRKMTDPLKEELLTLIPE